MDLELTDDQRALQESVRDFLRAECPVSLVRQTVELGEGAEGLWAKMVELDWPAMTVPEEHGGAGLGFVELAVVAEELGYALVPAPLLSTASQFVPAVRIAGTPGQHRRFLEPIARDGMVGTLAVAEAPGVFDLAHVQTEAVRDGSGWLLSGTKHFVLDATLAEEIVVVARVHGSTANDGIALFVVPGASARTAAMSVLDPTRKYCTVSLDGVRVEEDRALGEVGEAAPKVVEILEEATAAMAAEMVGTSQAMFDIVHDYVGQREQFGVKIGSFQAIKHKLADMYVALESARAITYFAALCVAELDDRRSLAVSMAKSSAGDCQKLLAQQSIQCLGGIGYTWEHDIHFYVKRVKSDAALFGTASEHREIVAASIGLRAEESSTRGGTGS
jgi:alkylation response protein AidB-like acyl-CoA dehydrogenase